MKTLMPGRMRIRGEERGVRRGREVERRGKKGERGEKGREAVAEGKREKGEGRRTPGVGPVPAVFQSFYCN